MTMGELAQLFNKERRIGVRLEVVKVKGWRREQLFRDQGLPWVNPSPNIRSWRQALLYGAVGLLEGTNLAVGRGTDAPFLLLGAPWIDGQALAGAVNKAGLTGVRAAAVRFTPRARPYKGEVCRGVRLLLTDAAALDPPLLGVTLALELRRLHPDRWETAKLQRLVRHEPTVQAVLAGDRTPAQIAALWQGGLARFARVRRRYLLY